MEAVQASQIDLAKEVSELSKTVNKLLKLLNETKNK